jgi:hypothetical protein
MTPASIIFKMLWFRGRARRARPGMTGGRYGLVVAPGPSGRCISTLSSQRSNL